MYIGVILVSVLVLLLAIGRYQSISKMTKEGQGISIIEVRTSKVHIVFGFFLIALLVLGCVLEIDFIVAVIVICVVAAADVIVSRLVSRKGR